MRSKASLPFFVSINRPQFFFFYYFPATASPFAFWTTDFPTIHHLTLFSPAFFVFPLKYSHDTMSTSRSFGDTPTTRCDDLPRRLTRSQRSRLIKSTRKLTKLLGENPMPSVNSPSPISSPQKKCQEGNAAALYSPILSITKKLARVARDPRKMAYHRESDTNYQWEDTGNAKSGPATLPRGSGSGWPPVLVLHPESNFESEIDGCISYVSSRVPSPSLCSLRKRPSSLFSVSTSKSCLHSPLECEKRKEEREASHRRKRFAKLARFLGERIPPDLLLPKPGSTKSNRGSPRRRRFLPSLVPPVPPVIPPIRAESPILRQEMPLSISPPRSLVGGCSRPTSVEKPVEVFETNEPTSPSTDAAPSHPLAQEHLRSHSESSISSSHEHSTRPRTNGHFEVDDNVDAASREDGKEPESYPLLVPPRSESRLAFLRIRASTPSPEPGTFSHRRERRQGWSGEWNAPNMQDVISKLRDLR